MNEVCRPSQPYDGLVLKPVEDIVASPYHIEVARGYAKALLANFLFSSALQLYNSWGRAF
jgi:hypothetical protein